jgi:hypothetical protein
MKALVQAAPERRIEPLRTQVMRLLFAALLAISTARAATVSELIRSVRQALAGKRSDPEVVFLVAGMKLTERLDDAVIEQLQSEGAGPKTVEELEWLREASAAQLSPTDLRLFEAPPSPPEDEQRQLIARARHIALEYTASLPNFLCTESMRRFRLPAGRAWKLADTVTMDVSYSQKDKESYKLLTIDGKPTNKTLKSIGGFKSDGEFGSLLAELFRPDAATFRWERWGNLRGTRVAVFAYLIERHNSKYTVAAATAFRTHRITTGMTGSVNIDPETARTLRFSDGDDGLPSTFAVRNTYSVLDYDYADVGGRQYLLPKRVDLRVTFQHDRARNIMEFGNYRKFASDATVTYEK